MCPLFRGRFKVIFGFINLIELAQKTSEATNHLFPKLADLGWYCSDALSYADLVELAEFIEGNRINSIDELMILSVEANIETIKKNVEKHFPKRYEALSSAISAHCSGQFFLSIPVFIIQAEGICIDITGKKFYSQQKGKPITTEVYERIDNDNPFKAFFSPLKHAGGIRANEDSRINYVHCPNRHEILHGIECAYGNRINSCKFLSLIDYLITAVWELENKVVDN